MPCFFRDSGALFSRTRKRGQLRDAQSHGGTARGAVCVPRGGLVLVVGKLLGQPC